MWFKGGSVGHLGTCFLNLRLKGKGKSSDEQQDKNADTDTDMDADEEEPANEDEPEDVWHGGLLGCFWLLIFLPFIFIFPTLQLELSPLPLLYLLTL